jgi:arginine decarboxylase
VTLAWRAILCTRGNPLRAAFFAEYTETNREYIPLDAAQTLVDGGRPLVSANFVVPYPPGFPILVPGQIVSTDILDFLRRVDVKEIHGYRPELGLSVFTETALDHLELLRGNLADIPGTAADPAAPAPAPGPQRTR